MDELKSILDTFVERHAQHIWSQGSTLDYSAVLDFGDNHGFICSLSIEYSKIAPNDEERTLCLIIFGRRHNPNKRIDCEVTMKNAMVVTFHAKRMCWRDSVFDSGSASQVYEFEWSAFPTRINDKPRDML